MRTRVQDSTTPLNALVQSRTGCASSSWTNHVSTWNVGKYKRIRDVVCASYFDIQRRGGVVPYLPCDILTRNVTHTPVGIETRQNPGTGTGSPCVVVRGEQFLPTGYWPTDPGIPPVDEGIIAFVMNGAISSAKDEAYDILTSLAEMGKTVDMIAGRVRSVFGYAEKAAVKARRKSNHQLQTEMLKRFTGYWLELRYGWRPLLADINNAIQQFQKVESLYQEGRRRTSQDLTRTVPEKTSYDQRAIWHAQGTYQGTRTYRGFAFAVGSFGQGPQARPLNTAWELVPYSFVVDWFMDIGGAINAFTPIPGVDIRASGYSIKEEYTKQVIFTVEDNPSELNHTSVQTQMGVFTEETTRYQRFPSSAIVPRFYPRLDKLKFADIVGLVVQKTLKIDKILGLRR